MTQSGQSNGAPVNTEAIAGERVPLAEQLNARPSRISTFLNPRRMRNASPQQRLRALRELRNARRSGAADESSETARRGNRLTRLFGRNRDSVAHSMVVPTAQQVQQPSEQQDQVPQMSSVQVGNESQQHGPDSE